MYTDEQEKVEEKDEMPSKEELIRMLDTMASNIEALPPYAKQSPVNQYDMLSLISLLSLILRSK